MRWATFAFYAGIAAAISVPLASLRLCGLKLLTLQGRPAGPAGLD
jgi:hypothetical protein